ncbi:TRAP transporter large permease [Chloroflexota bacterium]
METLGIVLMVVLIMVGVPVWASIFSGSIILLVVAMDMDPLMLTGVMYDKVHILSLISVPLFIFSGQVLASGGAAKPLIDVLNKFMGHIPGGPAYAMIAGCVVFAAMSSTGLAAIAGFAPIMIPMMVAMGYSKRFAIGLLLAAASLGPTIPPSIPLILYGYVTETSVKDLYTAAFLPGLMIALFLAVIVFIYTRKGHYAPPPPASWQERWRAVKRGWPVMLMPIVVLAPIYLGWNTPTEAAAIAAVYSLVLGFVIYRDLNLTKLHEALRTTVHLVAAIFLIVMAAFMLNLALTYVRIPYRIGDALTGAGLNSASMLILLILLYLIMGMFLDPSSILLISAPILFPTVVGVGISPIVFGVLVVVSVEIAGLTPPYGITLFASTAIIKEKFSFIARSLLMFYPALILGILLIAYVPQISLFLPNLTR